LKDENIVGGLCAELSTPVYSSDLIAYDQILYTVPDFNNVKALIALIKSYVKWAENIGAVEARLCSTTGYKQDGFTKLCNRFGFEQFGIDFARRF
jgi:hypothetical protein